MIVGEREENNLIHNIKVICIGQFCLNASNFFIVVTSIIRNKSPPLKTYLKKFKFLEVNNERI